MSGSLRDALRDRLDRRSLVLGLAFLVGLRVGLGASVAKLAMTGTLVVVAGLADAASEAYDLRESVERAWVGVVASVGSAGMIALGEDPGWLQLAFLAVGSWFLLDAVQTVRHKGTTDAADPPDGRTVYRDYVARKIQETLRDRPMTRRELSDAMESDDETVDAALEHLRVRGVVSQEGSELQVTQTEPKGRVARIHDWTGKVARRIARPLTLEFRSGGSDDAGPGDVEPAGRESGDGRLAREDDRQREPARER
ncbi:MFS transporter [Halobacteriales archaeon QS_1_68_20]|nr:MAG: MFS transporter [Halobacteriales archaeon QS_1_68_20]